MLFPEAIRDLDDFGREMFYEAYVSTLAGTPRHLIVRGLRSAAKSCKWFPKPAELLALIAEQKSRWMNGTDSGRPEKPVEDTEVNPDMQAKLSQLASGAIKR